MGCPVGGDNDRVGDSLVDTGFEEQRHVIDHHRLGVFTGGLSRHSCLFSRDAGMDDSLQLAAFRRMAKYDGAERMAVDGAVGTQYVSAEHPDDLSPGRSARLDDLPGQLIGVDDHCAALLEHACDGAFSCGDTARESHQNHGRGAYHAVRDPTRNPG